MQTESQARKSQRVRQRERFFREHGNRCAWCSSPDKLTIDHKKARCFGGRNTMDNWQILCHHCNHDLKARDENQLYYQLMMCYAPNLVSYTWKKEARNAHRVGLPLRLYSLGELQTIHSHLLMRTQVEQQPKKLRKIRDSLDRINIAMVRKLGELNLTQSDAITMGMSV